MTVIFHAGARTRLLFALTVFWLVPMRAADDCTVWSDARFGYSVCLPNGWYRRTMPSGALFLCNDRRGACTTPVGGGPLLGHATLSLVPAEVALEEAPSTLEEFAHQVSDKDASSQFSKIMSGAGPSATIRYVVVVQTFTTGARNEVPQVLYSYFAQADRKMVEFRLAFNLGDRDSERYRKLALKTVLSLQPKQ